MNEPRWMIRRDLKEAGSDPMLSYGTGRSWCAECGVYFASSGAFSHHRVGPWTDRRCLSVAELRAQGWLVNARGFWIMREMPAGALTARLGAAIDEKS